jgi:hypothetical protein
MLATDPKEESTVTPETPRLVPDPLQITDRIFRLPRQDRFGRINRQNRQIETGLLIPIFDVP